MEIQKQREAFEVFIANKYKDLIDQRVCINSDGDYMAWDMQVAWATWQAATAKVVPEGFVLVNAESLALHAQSIRMFNNGDEEDDYYEIENHVCAIEAMIEAQEQSHE